MHTERHTMKSALNNLFSPADLDRVEQAVRAAETQTSGEIIPYAVEASDGYEEAMWRGGMTFGGLALLTFVLIHNFSESWETFELMQIALGTLAATLAGGAAATYVDAIKRFFAGKELLERRVAQRSAEAFLAEEVFNTRDRTGILIFLSLLEHKVIVLGDSGINAMVQKSEWEGIVNTIVGGMREGKPADGLIEAIRQCGVLLHKQGVGIRADDKDELSNKLRTGNR